MADVPNVDTTQTIDLPEVTVKGKKPIATGGLLSKIGDFFSSIFKGNTSSSSGIPKTKADSSTPKTGIGMEPISAIVAGLGAISNGVFNFLGQKQETKQKQLDITALEKQKEVVQAQGDIETTKLLEAKIDLQKQELVNAQKKETGSNIVKLGIILGVLVFAGFVVAQVFKTPKVPKVNSVANPLKIK